MGSGVEDPVRLELRRRKVGQRRMKPRGAEFFAPIISDVDYLPQTGNILIKPGIVRSPDSSASYTLVTEVAYPDKEVVFEANIQFKNLLFTSPNLAWGQMNIVYRSERLPLYRR